MDELKQSHRKMDGPFRSAQEMERHQTQAQDAQVEEQIHVQTQFREHSAKLQNIFDRKQRVEVDITRKVSEERQLVGEDLVADSFFVTGFFTGSAHKGKFSRQTRIVKRSQAVTIQQTLQMLPMESHFVCYGLLFVSSTAASVVAMCQLCKTLLALSYC